MGKLWLACVTLAVSMSPSLVGCGSSCDATVAAQVAANSADGCLAAKPGTQGDTCGKSPTVLVDNNCSADWSSSQRLLVKAGEKGHAFSVTDAQLSGSLYTITGTIGMRTATVTWQIGPAPKN